jgi:Pyridoxamine 5'-phosphate oxidase
MTRSREPGERSIPEQIRTLNMSRRLESIDGQLRDWIAKQHVFFVATAPLSTTGHVNTSPKGADSFRILGPTEVAYQDFTGSGAETIAHLNENGRIVIMFCAFEGAPQIVRLHGCGSIVARRHSRFSELAALFPPHPGTRAFIHVTVNRVSSSCGYGVPQMDFRAHRDQLERWAASKGEAGLNEYRAQKNLTSIDGLPALPV